MLKRANERKKKFVLTFTLGVPKDYSHARDVALHEPGSIVTSHR